jgi:acid phosphatase family membrane protein YuiD
MTTYYIIYPLVSFAIAQGTKVLINTVKRGRFHWHDFFAYSDMPSGHTATVISLATIVLLTDGVASSTFAIAAVLAIVVITDAVGLRNYLGLHGKTLNVLVHDLRDDDVLESHYPRQQEHIGHTPLQVLAGGVIGAVVSIIGYLIF